MENRTVTVLGGGGYLGSVLCRLLLEQGFDVRCFDIFLFGQEPINDLVNHPGFSWIRGDIRDLSMVELALEGADTVVHLASFVGDASCNVNPELTTSINYAPSQQLAKLCTRLGVRRLLFSSTCSVYGGASDTVTEDSPTDATTPYTRTKLAAEQVFLTAKSATFHPTILRLATVFGVSPRMRFDLAVNIMVAQAQTTGHIKVFNGQRWRPFVSTLDVARAFLHVMQAPINEVSGGTFNVGSNHMNFTIADLARVIARRYPHVEVKEETNNDGRDYRVDFSRIQALGFHSQIDLDKGIREIAAYVRKWKPDLSESRYNNGLTTKDKLPMLLVPWTVRAISAQKEPKRSVVNRSIALDQDLDNKCVRSL